MVHLLSEQRDLNQPVSRKMVPAGNQLEALRETLEVLLLRRPQRVLAKERDDRPKQVSAPTDVVLHEVFTMIVVPGVSVEPADSEEALELLQGGHATCSLGYDETMCDLVAGLVAASTDAIWLSHEAD
jgi:hypothetical protein